MEAALALVPDERDDQCMSAWAQKQYIDKYAWKDEDGNPTEVWPDTAYRVTRNVLGALGYTDRDQEFQKVFDYIAARKFMPGGRYLANSGKQIHQVQNCTLYRCEDSREGWFEMIRKAGMALSLGAGVGVVYSDVRHKGALIKKTNGVASGALSPAKMLNEVAREVMDGGSRRSAIWAGLHWWHADVFDFIACKDWSEEIKALKSADFSFPAPMDMTNISVILDDEFFASYAPERQTDLVVNGSLTAPDGGSWHGWARRVYRTATEHMLRHAEPGFSIDVGENRGENLRNACTEITSLDDSDICNLGSVNMARIESLEEFREVVRHGTLLLLAGTVYSDVPHAEIAKTRTKNRRLGLGLMGVHEWLLLRGYSYGMNDELRSWLEVYRDESDAAAEEFADKHNLSRPIKKRAIAPNGTIGIVGETSTAIEPIFTVAEKRRFLTANGWRYQYVINPTAARLIEEHGVDPESIEDAYLLAYTYERRIAFQADVQEYVDHAISSTLNLPYPIIEEAEVTEFADTLMKYLPRLRGITCYPDGSRAGQPLTAVPYHVAKTKTGVTYEENEETCVGGACGI